MILNVIENSTRFEKATRVEELETDFIGYAAISGMSEGRVIVELHDAKDRKLVEKPPLRNSTHGKIHREG